jgi:VanZ family protein
MVLGTWVATKKLNIPPSMALNDYVIHIIVFFGFSFLMDLATSRHPFWLWKGLPLLMYGLSIEIMQYFSPDRTFSLLDLLADFLGILLFFILKISFLWLGAIKKAN